MCNPEVDVYRILSVLRRARNVWPQVDQVWVDWCTLEELIEPFDGIDPLPRLTEAGRLELADLEVVLSR